MNEFPLNQNNNTVTNGDIVGGNKTIYQYKDSKLGALFKKLNDSYNQGNKINDICDDLKKYIDSRDRIGLEKKLKNGSREHLFENARRFKEDYAKKLEKFQFYEPAQEIHAFILAFVVERFVNLINPLISSGEGDTVILKTISNEIINPLSTLIQQEGCDDIMGLTNSDINGMVYFLTGKCHLTWEK